MEPTTPKCPRCKVQMNLRHGAIDSYENHYCSDPKCNTKCVFRETRGCKANGNVTKEMELIIERLAIRYNISKSEVMAIMIWLALERHGESNVIDAYIVQAYQPQHRGEEWFEHHTPEED